MNLRTTAAGTDEGTRREQSGADSLLLNLAFALLYFSAARLTVELTAPDTQASPAFVPAGLGVCAALFLGSRAWQGVLAGALIKNVYMLLLGADHGSPLSWVFVCISALGSTFEAVVGASLVRRACAGGIFPGTPVQALKWLGGLSAACLPPALLGGVFVHLINHRLPSVLEVGVTWWSGDLWGILILLVFAHAFSLDREPGFRRRDLAVPVAGAVAAIGAMLLYDRAWVTLGSLGVLTFLTGWMRLRRGLRATGFFIGCSSLALAWAASNDRVRSLSNAYSSLLFPAHMLLSMAIAWSPWRQPRRVQGVDGHRMARKNAWSFEDLELGLPVRVLILVVSFTTVGSAALSFGESRAAAEHTRRLASETREQIQTLITASLSGQEHLAGIWGAISSPERFWDQSISNVLQAFPFVEGAQRLDASLRLRGLRTEIDGKSTQPVGPSPFPDSPKWLEDAQRSGVPVASPLIRSADGSVGFLAAAPIRQGAASDGFLVQKIRLEPLLAQVAKALGIDDGSHLLTMDGGNGVVFSKGMAVVGTAMRWQQSVPMRIRNQSWKISVSPHRNSAVLSQLRASNVLMLAGCLFGPLVGVLIHLRQRARQLQLTAEAASRAKSDFLATMSHEIRTPMNGILGMTELLQASRLDARQRELADHVASSGAALLSIINAILDLSKIEAGHMTLVEGEFDLPPLIDGVVALVAPSGRGKAVSICAEIEPGLPTRYRGDAGRLRQVLVNLVGNGLKFTQAGSVVMRVRSAGTQEGRARLRFEVTDTGMGIPASEQALLFKPFQQLDSSAARRHGGTGLGLAISRQLVELMDGVMGMESKEGRGSTFWFEIALPPIPTAPPASMDGLRVLLAQENAIQRRLTTMSLQKLGCCVAAVGSGNEALSQIQDGQFDALVMEAQVADSDGFALASAMRLAQASAPSSRACAPRLIVLDSSGRWEDGAQVASTSVTVVRKSPVGPAQLKEALLATAA